MSADLLLGAVIAAVAAVPLVLLGLFLERWPYRSQPVERLVEAKVRSRLIVTLKSGAAFDGVLYAADADAWVLRGVSAIGAGDHDADVPVDGELLVLVADIDFVQRP